MVAAEQTAVLCGTRKNASRRANSYHSPPLSRHGSNTELVCTCRAQGRGEDGCEGDMVPLVDDAGSGDVQGSQTQRPGSSSLTKTPHVDAQALVLRRADGLDLLPVRSIRASYGGEWQSRTDWAMVSYAKP
ncbi:hypothetical protein ACJQWK_04605 [Exserohilum turcicum]|uniref:Uncharacterized protein n=1 Tax=Exserohilum turcicum (strain 28A) TaxID=671987 RepID=R0JNH9_EXST2|nr:uncharacterized protein SETTUDRAFT_43604 [Exserohilum turcica Et28A]EOA82768.1 hypothetical protein SETTUDRAFT_43604 [Exserohilum turcica Et28A]